MSRLTPPVRAAMYAARDLNGGRTPLQWNDLLDIGYRQLGVDEIVGRPMLSAGAVAIAGGRTIIYYREGMSCREQRLTLAHELGHLLYRHTLRGLGDHGSVYADWADAEQPADLIALELLAPRNRVRDMLRERPDEPRLAAVLRLCEIFDLEVLPMMRILFSIPNVVGAARLALADEAGRPTTHTWVTADWKLSRPMSSTTFEATLIRRRDQQHVTVECGEVPVADRQCELRIGWTLR